MHLPKYIHTIKFYSEAVKYVCRDAEWIDSNDIGSLLDGWRDFV